MNRALRLARRAGEIEALTWVNLVRWVTRRPASREPGARAFGYARPVTPVLIAFIVVSAIEIPILDLVLPWRIARIISVAIGVYGLLWMLGLLAGLRVNPHVVAPSGLRVRGNWGLDVTIPWDHIATCRARNRTLTGRDIQTDHSGPHPALSIGVMKQTHVDVVFRQPTTLELPSGETEPVRELRIAADEPAALVAAIQPWLGAAIPPDPAYERGQSPSRNSRSRSASSG